MRKNKQSVLKKLTVASMGMVSVIVGTVLNCAVSKSDAVLDFRYHNASKQAMIEASLLSENETSIMFNNIVIQQNEESIILSESKAYKKPDMISGLVVNYRDGFKVSKDEREILYRIVEAEAGGEDSTGRLLVANVILNRCVSKNFPNSIKKVVFAPRQFSPISNGSYYRVKVSKITKKAVNDALDGIDISDGAVYFMCRRLAASKNVSWFDNELNYLFRYGCHEFFKD